MDNRRSHRAKFIVLLLLTTILYAQGPSFRTPRLLTEHYLKHGPEFGHITKLEYLRLAQQLRDAPVGGPILESRRPDGEFSRFDRRHGYFGRSEERRVGKECRSRWSP